MNSQLTGAILEQLGKSCLILGAGLLLGYFVADQSVSFISFFLPLVLVLFAASLISIILGRKLVGKIQIEKDKSLIENARTNRRISALLILLIMVAFSNLALFWIERPSDLTNMNLSAYEKAFGIDSERYLSLERGLELSVQQLEESGHLFPSDSKMVLSSDQEASLRSTWCSLYEQAFALDQIRVFYEDYYRFDPSMVQRTYHVRSFLLTFLSEATLFEKALRIADVIGENKNAQKFLNVPHEGCGLPEGSYDLFRRELLGVRDHGRVLAGKAYFRMMEETTSIRSDVRDWGVDWMWLRLEKLLISVFEIGTMSRMGASLRGDFQPVKKVVRRVWFPAQTHIAEWLGDTRLRRIGWYLINEEQAANFSTKLKPGDILVSRKNWYLSNIGLPGFWPHAVLYLGNLEKLEDYFDDSAVLEWVRAESGKDLSFVQWLRLSYPSAFSAYSAKNKMQDNEVIEAISEGVVFNTLHKAAGDYLGAMRPRLDRLSKAQAIAEAFKYWNRPYDFDFDFATDHALVCTELVWRSYRPGINKQGLDFSLVEVAGRQTLPANEIVRSYSRTNKEDSRQLDFVGFLDAREKQRKVMTETEDAFASSAERSKWGELR